MLVKQLIKKLSKADPNLEVRIHCLKYLDLCEIDTCQPIKLSSNHPEDIKDKEIFIIGSEDKSDYRT